MRSQGQAFQAYYAAMTDAELLHIAANESSFIAIAQKTLDNELAKRRLKLSAPPPPPPRRSLFARWGDHLPKWAGRLHHRPASP
jgi:hypothetical protein